MLKYNAFLILLLSSYLGHYWTYIMTIALDIYPVTSILTLLQVWYLKLLLAYSRIDLLLSILVIVINHPISINL